MRDAARSASLIVIAGALVFLGVAGLLGALFLALSEYWGPVHAALCVSGLTFALALAITFPIWRPKRRPAPPPQPTLADFVSAVTRSAPSLTPKQIALAAVLGALALGLMAGAKSPKEKSDE